MNSKILRDRAKMLSDVRAFFFQREVMEVDCPLLTQKASVDAHIDLIQAKYAHKHTRYLHSSPEYGMKRLLAEGAPDIYQLSHVFRDAEWGQNHSPEFMMAEWYRKGFSFEELIEESVDFICLFLGPLKFRSMGYREVFQHYLGIDYLQLPFDGRDDHLNLLLGDKIEPQLGQDGELFVLTHYPASQAALSKKVQIGDEWASERFEIYFKGVELANGYCELTDVKEQKLRFEEANSKRIEYGKESLPIDTFFLEALDKGLPECAGVAIGFDRLMMLRHDCRELAEVLPFPWDRA